MDKKIDFIGIGVAKSGTTWVAECLEEHPEILFPGQKELFFFNKKPAYLFYDEKLTNHHKGIQWYLNQFPEPQKNKIMGEFATNYYNDPDAAKEIKKHFPNIKIIAILRNPVNMLYSLYWYGKAAVRTQMPESFEKMVDEGLYLERGLLYKHLKKFYDHFPKNNIHIILLDDVKTKSKKVLKNLYEFLEVDPNFKPSILDKKSNPALKVRYPIIDKFSHGIIAILDKLNLQKQVRVLITSDFLYNIYKKINLTRGSNPPMKHKTRNRLIKYYKEDLNKLEQLIDRDLSAWKK